ncbi:MAG: LamG domain-containing protein, partial [Cytophagales bacterium]
MSSLSFAQTTYTFTAAGGNFQTATNWSPARTVLATNDILVFTTTSNITVNNVPSQTILQLRNIGTANVRFDPVTSTNITLSIDGGNLNNIDLQNGGGGGFNFNTAGGGTINVITKNIFIGTGRNIDLTNINTTGFLTVSGLCTNSGGGITNSLISGTTKTTFLNASVYNHNVNGGNIPFANWLQGSTCSITGIIGNDLSQINQSFWDLTWDCAGQNVTRRLISTNGQSMSVLGTFFVRNTNNQILGLFTGNAGETTNFFINNLQQSNGTLQLANNGNTNAALVRISGNITQTGGSMALGGAGSLSVLSLTGANSTINMLNGFGNIPLVVNKNTSSTSVDLNANLAMTGSLTFLNGMINSNAFVLSTSGNVTGASATTGWVNGNLARNFAVGTNVARTFDVGNASIYAPFSINFPSVTTQGFVRTSFTNGENPNTSSVCLDASNSVNAFWNITTSGPSVLPLSFAPTFSLSGINVDGTVTNSSLIGAVFQGSSLQNYISQSGSTASSVTLSNASNLGNYVLAQRNTITSNIGSIIGNANSCINQSSAYSVTSVAGSIYTWAVPSGYSIVSGQGTSLATISVSGVASSGLISVSGSSACYSGLIATTTGITLSPTYLSITSLPTNALSYLFSNSTNDGSGSNTAVLLGNVTPNYTLDRFNNANSAISLNEVASTPTRQSVSNTSQVSGIANFSLSIWIKTSSTQGGWIVGRQNGSSNDRKIFMNDNGIVRFGVYNGSVQTIASSSALNDNKWHHLVATHSTTNGIQLFVDGVLNSSSTLVSTDGNSGNWNIGNGSNWGGANGSTNSYFTGSVDEFTYYIRILTQAEIDQLYGNSIIYNNPVCIGGNLILQVGTATGANYAWSGPNGFTSSISNPTILGITTSATGTYSVTVSFPTCSLTPITRFIDVAADLVNTITGTQTVCSGIVPLNPFTGSVLSGYTYQWEMSTISGVTGFTTISGATLTGFTVTTSAATNRWYRRFITNGICALYSNTIGIFLTTPDFNEALVYPSGYFAAYAYRAQNWPNANYAGFWTVAGAGLTFDTQSSTIGYAINTGFPHNAPNYQGCQTGNTNYSISVKAQNIVTSSGNYMLNLPYYDDATEVLIDNTRIFYDGTWFQNIPKNNVCVTPINSSSLIEVKVTQAGGGGGVAFNFTPVTTLSALNPGQISGSITGLSTVTSICPGTLAPTLYNFTTPSGGCCIQSYKWQQSPDGIAWTDLSNSNSVTYTHPLTLSQDTYFRRIVFDRCGNSATSAPLLVDMNKVVNGNPSIFGTAGWNSYFYRDMTRTSYAGNFSMPGLNPTTSGLSFDTRNYFASATAPSTYSQYDGCPISNDNISASFKRTNFTPGFYNLNMIFNDDNVNVLINGQSVFSRAFSGTAVTAWTGYLSATDQIEMNWDQGGGGSGLAVNFVPISTFTGMIAGSIAYPTSVCSGEIPQPKFITLINSTGCGVGLIKNYQWQSSTTSSTTGFTNLGTVTTVPTYQFISSLPSTTYLRRIDNDWCNQSITLPAIALTVTNTSPGDTSVFGSSQWISYAFSSSNWTNYKGYFPMPTQTFNSLNYFNTTNNESPSSSPGYQGCAVPGSTFSTRTKRQGFTSGTYNLQFSHDDLGVVIINGIEVFRLNNCCSNNANIWTGTLGATDRIEIYHNQFPGPAYYGLALNLSASSGLTNGGTIGTSQSICLNSSISGITNVANPANGGCTNYFRWESSTSPTFASINSLTGLSISNALSGTVLGIITQTTFVRRVAISACGGASFFSNVVTITANPILTSGTISTVAGVCAGNIPSTITSLSLPTGGTSSFTYQWEISTNNTTFAGIPSATNINFTPTAPISVPTFYRRRVTDASCGTTVTSATLADISPATTVTGLSSSLRICPGETASFSAFTNAVTPTYRWGYSTSSVPGTFVALNENQVISSGTFTGVNTSSLTIKTLSSAGISLDNTFYSVSIVGSCGQLATSTGLKLDMSINPLVISNVQDLTVCGGNVAVFSYTMTGSPIGYQWQQSTDNGSNYFPISDNATFSGTNTNSLTISGAFTTALHNTRYRSFPSYIETCNSFGGSNVGTLSTTSTINNNISVSGIVSSICSGNQTTIIGENVTVPGFGAYQWQSSTNGSSWSNITSSGVSQNYTVAGLTTNSFFRRIANSNFGCTSTSTGFLLTVNPNVAFVTNLSATLTTCAGPGITLNTSATGTPLINYQWQMGGVNISDNATFSGTNTRSLTLSTILSSMNGLQFRVVASSVCGSAISTQTTFAITNLPTFVTQPIGRQICEGELVTIFNGSATGVTNYQWQRSLDGGNSYSDISNTGDFYNNSAITVNLLPSNTLTKATYHGMFFRLKATNACPTPSFSNGAVLTVISPITGNAITTTNQTICPLTTFVGLQASTTTGTINTLTGGSGIFDVYWTSSPNNATWTTIVGQTFQNYNPLTVAGTTFFRRTVYSGTCPVSNSNSVSVTVNPATTVTSSPTSILGCANSSVVYSVTAQGSALNYQWQYSSDNGTSYADVTNPLLGNSLGFSPTSNNLNINNMRVNLNGFMFRVIVSGNCPPNLNTSTGAVLSVGGIPTVTSTLTNSICSGTPLAYNITSNIGGSTFSWTRNAIAGISNPATTSGLASITETLGVTSASPVRVLYSIIPSGPAPSVCVGVASVLTVTASASGSWNGFVSSDWNNAGNWCGGVPSASNAIIPSGVAFMPVITTLGVNLSGLTILGSASLTLNSPNNLSISGNVINNGILTMPSSSTVALNGANQSIGGSAPTSISNLVLAGTGIKTLNSSVIVSNSLTLGTNITLNAGNNLTLVSNASGTGRVAALPSGAIINGNVTVQRYIPAKRSTRYFSSPVLGATLNNW